MPRLPAVPPALALAAGLLAAALTPLPGVAQVPFVQLEISPYVGGFFTGDLEVQELEDSPLLGARAALLLPVGLGVEGQFGWAPLESRRVGIEAAAFDVTALLFEGGLSWALPLPGPVDPFLGLGVGTVMFDPDLSLDGGELEDESSLVASAGVGLRITLGSWGLRADLRDHVVFDALEEASRELGSDEGGETLNALEASVGVRFLFF